MVLKIEFEKAYDKINWDLLQDTLLDVGIPRELVRVIMYCVSTTSFQVLWNGATTEVFQPSCGIRQGDPLSPYLFVLCIERLRHLIEDIVVIETSY